MDNYNKLDEILSGAVDPLNADEIINEVEGAIAEEAEVVVNDIENTDEVVEEVIEEATDTVATENTDEAVEEVIEKATDEATDTVATECTDEVVEEATDEATDTVATENTDEAVEEVIEEATDEVADTVATENTDEVVEEVIEEATDEITDTVATENTDEAVEEVIEEAIDTVATENTDEVGEEVIEEVTDEATDTVATECTDEAVAEAIEEATDEIADTVATENTDEVVEEAIEEVTDEVTDTVATENTDEVVEEVIEEVTDNVATENTDEVVEEVTDEATDTVATENTDEQEEKLSDLSEIKYIDVALEFNEKEENIITEFAKSIELTDINAIIQYGVGAQKHAVAFGESVLEKIRTKDMSQLGDKLTHLLSDLTEYNTEDSVLEVAPVVEKKRLFSSSNNQAKAPTPVAVPLADKFKNEYQEILTEVSDVNAKFEDSKNELLKDISLYNKMQAMNEVYYKEISMYIKAGNLALNNAENEKLTQLREKAIETENVADIKIANEYHSNIQMFEKRLNALDLTRSIIAQIPAVLRFIKDSDSSFVEKIHTVAVEVTPMWRSKTGIALGYEKADGESANAVVDVVAINEVNSRVIDAITEIIDLQKTHTIYFLNAERDIRRIVDALKTKLLEVGLACDN